MVLSLAMPDEPVLRKCWRDWMLGHLANGDELDNSPTGTLVRYTADGIWLSELTEGITMSPEHRQALVDSLNKMTLPREVPWIEVAMRYNINARFIYDATDGTLTLPQSTEPDCQLSITSCALLNFFCIIPISLVAKRY